MVSFFEDELSSIRLLDIFLSFAAILGTCIAAWLIPDFLRRIFRDKIGLEVNFNTKEYRKLLMRMHLRTIQRKTQPATADAPFKKEEDEIDAVYVDSKFKQYHHGFFGYMRSNFFIILYFVARFAIFLVGLFYSLKILHQDLIENSASLGIGFFVAVLQLGDYFKNFLAHLALIFSGKVKLGDLISLDGGNSYGQVGDFGILCTTIWTINPNHNWTETLKHLKIKQYSKMGEEEVVTPDADSSDTLYTNQMMSNVQNLYNTPATMSTMPQQFTLLNTLQNQTAGAYSGMMGTPKPFTAPIHASGYASHFIPIGNGHGHGHRVYDQEFIELQVPNVLLVLGTVQIIHH